MLVLPQTIRIKWNRRDKEYYEQFGYIYQKGEEFDLDVLHLSKGSKHLVKVKCDYCGTVNETVYSNYFRYIQRSTIKKSACGDCKVKKLEEENLKKHGIKNVFELVETKNKIIKTNIDKYGVPFLSQSPKIREKIKKSNLKKYGVEHPSQLSETKEKIKKSNLKKYGVEHHMKVPEILEKSRLSLYKNGKIPASKQQRWINQVLGGELNYPLKMYSLDIAWVNEKIYLEYDGNGHDLTVKLGSCTEKEFNKRECSRYYLLKSHGWKQIKIISRKNYLPSENKIKDMIKEARWIFNQSEKTNWIVFDIDERTMKTKTIVEKYDYGKLKIMR